MAVRRLLNGCLVLAAFAGVLLATGATASASANDAPPQGGHDRDGASTHGSSMTPAAIGPPDPGEGCRPQC